jgi:TRAP-type C4-dicarboxylate transport system permease small subunit
MRERLSAFLTAVIAVAGHVSTAALLIGVAINFINVVGRYFFHHSLEWAEEIMIDLMLTSVFLGGAMVSLKGAHIAMDIMLKGLPPRLQFAAELLNDAIQIVVGAIMIWLSVPVIYQLFEFDQRSEAMRIPIYIPQMVIPIGFALMMVGIVLHRRIKLKNHAAAGKAV